MKKNNLKKNELAIKSARILNSIYDNEVEQVILSLSKDKLLVKEIKKVFADELTGVATFLAIQEIGVIGQDDYCVLSKKKDPPQKSGDVIYVDFKAKKVLKRAS